MNVISKDLGSGIKSITLNDPKTYNSLSFKTLNELSKLLKKFDTDNKTRVIIINGNGKGFSAGHNLKEVKSLKVRSKYLKLLTEFDSDNKTRVIIINGNGKGFSAGHNLKEVKSLKVRSKYLKLFNLCSKVMIQIVEGRKPVIAKVHGAAFAAGCQLAASCDLAYSTNDAIFATPGVNIGLFCSTPMVAVSRKINRKQMMKMLLTGEPIKASFAKQIGLINDHFSKQELNKEVLNIAKKISSKSNLTIKIGKRAFYKQLEMPLNKAYKYTSEMMTLNMMAMDAKEGISAFLEKRSPRWRHK